MLFLRPEASSQPGVQLRKVRVEMQEELKQFCNTNDMKDMNTISASFEGDWRAVIDFLTGVAVGKVKRIGIAREKEQKWKVDIHNLKHEPTRKSNPLAGLYDLSW